MNTILFQSSRGPPSITSSRSSGSKSKTRRRKMKQRHYFTAPISYNETMLHNDMTLYDVGASKDNEDNNNNSPVMRSYVQTRRSPFPTMPSELFTNLAQSQFELLSNSLVYTTTTSTSATPTTTAYNKISSMALYLPKENEFSGQLEFVPAVTYPDPSSENKRVFIANSAVEEKSSNDDSNNNATLDQQNLRQPKQQHQPPVIPSSIQTPLGLPGFFQAKDLIPRYPFVTSSDDDDEDDVSSNDDDDDFSLLQQQQQREMMFTTVSPDSKIGVSVVEEISSSTSSGSTVGDDNDEVLALPQPLSVTLFSGMETLGVLMIWPNKNNIGRDGGKNSNNNNQRSNNNTQWNWTANDKLQVSRAAKSLALALSMDNERVSSQISSEQFQVAMADSLHQVKSPLQALRTFGKLLQRQLAEENNNNNNNNSASGVVAGGSVGPTIRRQRQMLKLAENMAAQGERVVDLIEPMDMLVNTRSNYLLSGDVKQTTTGGLALVRSPSFLLPNGSNYNDDNDDDDSVKSSPVLGDLQMELAFPNDVLGSCVYAFSMVSREKGINFDATGFEPDAELPACLISSKQLQEAVSNVIDNAIKYAPMRRKGSRGRPRIPTVKVSLTSNEPPLAAGCTLWIEDNGPGIPDDERESIFERGYRSKEWKDEVDGTGLGLAVARQMITQMGGKIDLVEDGGPSKLQGTTVRIILFRDPET
jgi:signal transduction histidine kinase